MQPTQVQLIDCVAASLEQYVEPELQGPMAQSQLLTVKYLLHQLRLRVLHESEALADYVQDLRRTLADVRDACAGGAAAPTPSLERLAAAIDRSLAADAGAPDETAGPVALGVRTDALRTCLDDALRSLDGGAVEPGATIEAEAALGLIAGCITRHFEREARWLVSDYSAPRR